MSDDVQKLIAAADAVHAARLRQQARRAAEEVKNWPEWMQEVASAPVLRCCSCGKPITVQEGYEGDTCKECLFG